MSEITDEIKSYLATNLKVKVTGGDNGSIKVDLLLETVVIASDSTRIGTSPTVYGGQPTPNKNAIDTGARAPLRGAKK